MKGKPFVLVLLVSAAMVPLPNASAESGPANVLFEATVPAPVLAMATSADGADVLVADEDARFTFLSDLGETERSWTAPNSGKLALLQQSLGEVPAAARGAAVTPNGDMWAGAIAYADEFPGAVFGFGHWSDEPIWRFDLPDPAVGADADQPRVLIAAGPYHAVGTELGTVYLLKPESEGSQTKHAHRTYTQDNQGNRFQSIHDLALAADGKRLLIGTAMSGTPSLHLFSDTFFVTSFKRIEEPIQRVAISADGSRGVAITGTQAAARAHLLDLDKGETIWETTIGATVNDLALSDDGKVLLVGAQDGNLHVFRETGNITDREPVAKHYLGAAIADVAIAANGHALAAATDSGVIHYLDVNRDGPLWTADTGTPLVAISLGHDEELLIASGRSGDSGRVIFTGADHALEHLAPPQPRLLPGTENLIPVEIANNGNRMETVRAKVGALPPGWSTEPAEVLIAPGEQKTLHIPITVAKGQVAKTYALPIALATATGDIPLHIDGAVPEIALGKTSVKWKWDRAVPGGAPAAFILQLENLGNIPNTMALGYQAVPKGWEVDFLGPVEARIQPGDDREVTMIVRAPRDAPIGREAWFDVVAAWQDGDETLPVSILLIDGRQYHDDITLATGSDDPTIGPLQERLRGEAKDLAGNDPYVQDAPGKKQSKESPGGGFVLLALAGVAAAIVVQRRRA